MLSFRSVRHPASIFGRFALLVILMWIFQGGHKSLAQQVKVPEPPQLNHKLNLQFQGEQPRPLAMVSGDFDEDGVQDLVIGYGVDNGGSIELLRGNPDAITPRTEAAWLAASRHEYVDPFVQRYKSLAVSTQPSVMVSADVNGDGHLDLVYATAGSSVLYVLFGTGQGTFSKQPASISLPGGITALTAYRPGAPILGEAVVVGYQLGMSGKVSIVSFSSSALKVNATFTLPNAPTSFAVANLDDDLIPDTAIVAGGELRILHGQNAINSKAWLEVLPVSNAESVAAGDFLFDRHGLPQLAVLTSDGDVLYLAHQGFDSRPFTSHQIASAHRDAIRLGAKAQTLAEQAGLNGYAPWVEVERTVELGLAISGSDASLMLRSRMSGSGGDDLVVLNPSQQKRVTISHSFDTSHALESATAQASLTQAPRRRVGVSSLAPGGVVAALSMRVNADGRYGLVILNRNDASPEISVPGSGNTFYVNVTQDNTGSSTHTPSSTRCTQGQPASNPCTLRDAITYVNSDAVTNMNDGTSDTIVVPAGTYPLTWQSGVMDANSNRVTHLEIAGPVTIMGASGAIIDGHMNDSVFTINPGPVGSYNTTSYVFDTTIENVTIQNGENQNNPLNNNTGLFNNVGGGINWDAFGTGNLTLSNVTVKNSSAIWGPGGGIWGFNSTGGGSGTLTISGNVISNNQTSEQGGGIYIAFAPAALSVSNTTISGNVASVSVNSQDQGGSDGQDTGAGIFLSGRATGSGTPQSMLSGLTISSNVANGDGAGINTATGMVLATSVVSNNSSRGQSTSAETANPDSYSGGGFWSNVVSPPEVAPTITSTNFLQNSAYSPGGAIAQGNGTTASGNTLQISLSRIFGNTSSTGASGLALGQQNSTNPPYNGTVTATNNWWGCNAGPTTSSDGCDQAAIYPSGTTYGTLSVSPWATFGFSATTATTINIGSNIDLSLTLNTNSSNQSISGAFPAVSNSNYTYSFMVTGVPADAIPAGTFSTKGTGSATLTPTGTGSGTVSATFDGQTDKVNFTVNQIGSSLQLTVSPSASFPYGQPPTSVTVQFNPSGASGISASAFQVVLDGTASNAFSFTSLGGNLFQIAGPFNLLSRMDHTFEVKFLGTTDYQAANTSTTLTVTLGTTTIGDTVTPTNPIQGQGGMIAVTVTGVGSGAVPTGSISYDFDGGTSHTVALVGGSAQISIPTVIASGSHTLALTYNGDSNYITNTTSTTLTIFGRSQTNIVSLTATAATINVYGLGFTPPSGQLSFTDVSTHNPVAGVVTLNTAHATTALTPMVANAPAAETLPVWTTMADLNGDGILDLITSQYATDSVTVQLGNGDGTFQTATTVFHITGFGPAEVHAASLRGGKKLDLIIGSFNVNEIAVLLGNGNGTFDTTPATYTVGSATNTPTSLTTGDFNNDGNLDVAVTNYGDNTISILSGDGTGHLVLPESPINVGHGPEAIRAGDFNGDTVPDLVVANYADGTVTTLLNNGSGTFTAKTLSVGSGAHSGPQALAINGSGGSLKLAVANFKDNSISVMQSNGSGGFGPQTIVKVGIGPDDVNFADFNGDGVPDMVVANYSDSTVNLVLGSSGGTYSVLGPFTVGKNPYSAAVGDLDLDGTPDVVVSNCFGNNTGVLLDGTLISTSYTGLSLTGGHELSGAYTPDSNSKYGSSVSASVTAP
jgi:FG-GAP-like repeat